MSKSINVVKQIKRATRRKFSADEKIRIVLEGLRGEESISELCRREGIAPEEVVGQEQWIRRVRWYANVQVHY